MEVSTGGTGTFAKLTTAKGQSYALFWPTALPKPTVKGNVATYTDAAGPGADLVVTVLPTGFQHDVVLREQPKTPLELRIGVETSGVTLTEGKSGRLLLTGNDKKLMASAPQPVMWDARAKGHLAGAKQAKVSTDVVTKAGRTELVLKPDHKFLSDKDTIYPVRVDPTVTLPSTDDVGLFSTDTVDSPAYPSGSVMSAGVQTGQKMRSYLRFNTGNLQGQAITDAKLSMLNVDSSACGAAVSDGLQVRRVTGTWDVNNLYWANKPTATTEDAQINKAGYSTQCTGGAKPLDWNVTAIAQDWAAGAANHGLVVQSPTESTAINWRYLTTSEDTQFNQPPTLTITTSGPSSSPTVSGLTITPSQDVAGTIVTNSLTPQLTATVTDAIGGNLTGEFEVEHDPTATAQGTGQIWAGASPAVVSGSPATVTVPAQKLTDGWKLRWRARAVNAGASTSSAWSAWQNVTVDVPDTTPLPTVGALQVVPSQQVDGKTVTSSLTPSLQAHVSDQTAATLRAEFELEHDPAATGQGTGQIWTGVADNVASGSQASATIPTGKLTDGWKVRWRARAVVGERASNWSEWQLLAVDTVNPGEEPLAQTAGPVIRTDQSFTVAAWLRWTDKDGNYSVAEQRGVHQAPFRLGNTADHGLVFTLTSADSASATTEGVLSGVEPPVATWFHLAGVYDAAAKTAALYLDGKLVKTQPLSFAGWHAEQAMTLGTSMRGDLDELRTYQRPLTADEVGSLAAASPTAAATPPATTTATPEVTELATLDEPDPYEVNYRHFTLDTCRAKGPKEAIWGIWTDATVFSGCSVRWFGVSMWFDDIDPDNGTKKKVRLKLPDGSEGLDLMMRSTTVINTYLGTRDGKGIRNPGSDGVTGPLIPKEFSMWVAFDQVDYQLETGIGNSRLELSVTSKPGSSGSTCTKTVDGDQEAPVKDWNGTARYFRFKSESDSEKVRRCSVFPWVKIKDLVTEVGPSSFPLWGKMDDDRQNGIWTPPTVRCDDLTLGPGSPGAWPEEKRVRYQGACIFPDVSRIYRTDVDHVKRGPVAAHIWAAFNTPDSTDPKKAPGQKVVPGNWDGQTARARAALTRINENELRPLDPNGRTWKEVQRSERGKACRAAQVVGDCDEFPFNSVKEGPGWGDGNFSVRGVPAKNNRSDGWYLTVFYGRYRVLVPEGTERPNGDRFWVSVKGTP